MCIELPLSAEAPRTARVRMGRWCSEMDICEPRRETMQLLVSEIVTNAVLHSEASPESDITLRARTCCDDAIRVEVVDCGRSAGTPAIREPQGQGGGYGLFIVASVAKRWGVEQNDDTTVWFEA
jgi:serine/threonine-protein kinase RsbW